MGEYGEENDTSQRSKKDVIIRSKRYQLRNFPLEGHLFAILKAFAENNAY